MTMYDYRSTKKRVSRAPLRVGVLRRHRPRPVPTKKFRPSSALPFRAGWLGSLLVWLVGGVVVAGVSGYVALKFILPSLFPLETLQTVLLVSSQPNSQEATVILFNPEVPNITLAHLTDTAVPPLSGNLSLAEVNQKMGKLMDQIIVLAPSEHVTDPQELKQFLLEDIKAKRFGTSRGDKFKVWLFAQSLSSTQILVKEIPTAAAWQQFVENTAKQISLNACSIALVNTTKTAGLGKNISQLLEQSGYQVIKVDSQGPSLSISEVHVGTQTPSCLAYADRLSKSMIGGQPSLKLEAQQPQLYRADIVIFLGEDMGTVRETTAD